VTQPDHKTGEEDSSGNPVEEPPRRNDADGPLEDDDAKAQPGHPGAQENFRGGN
jgi:hypothetical protein